MCRLAQNSKLLVITDDLDWVEPSGHEILTVMDYLCSSFDIRPKKHKTLKQLQELEVSR